MFHRMNPSVSQLVCHYALISDAFCTLNNSSLEYRKAVSLSSILYYHLQPLLQFLCKIVATFYINYTLLKYLICDACNLLFENCI